MRRAILTRLAEGEATVNELVMGAAWRPVLTPRLAPGGDTVSVPLAEAIRAGAVVMWRTYADDMPDESAAITLLVACLSFELTGLVWFGGARPARGRSSRGCSSTEAVHVNGVVSWL